MLKGQAAAWPLKRMTSSPTLPAVNSGLQLPHPTLPRTPPPIPQTPDQVLAVKSPVDEGPAPYILAGYEYLLGSHPFLSCTLQSPPSPPRSHPLFPCTFVRGLTHHH